MVHMEKYPYTRRNAEPVARAKGGSSKSTDVYDDFMSRSIGQWDDEGGGPAVAPRTNRIEGGVLMPPIAAEPSR